MANQFVVYQDERHGLGAWVAEQIAADLFRNRVSGDLAPAPASPDAPAAERALRGTRVAADYGMRLSAAGGDTALLDGGAPAGRALDRDAEQAYRTWTSPRTTADAALSAVIGRQAQIAVVPLYDNDRSFDRNTLGALIDFQNNEVIREYVAESNYVLAAPSDLVHEIEQAGYTDSFSASGSSAAFQWNRDKQVRYLRRVTTIYASADAMKHCGPALDGFRAQGIDVQLIPDNVDSYREGLRIAADMLDPNRRIETHFSNNSHTRISRSRGANHTKPVVAVLLSADKAMKPDGYAYDSDYVVLEAEMAGADRIRTSFLALRKGKPNVVPDNVDKVAFEMAALSARFDGKLSSGKGQPDHRALYPIPGEDDWPTLRPVEKPAYVRALYVMDTVGTNARDISPVLKALAEEKLSYTTTTLENRPGHPMVVAIDIPAGKVTSMVPVLKQITKMAGWRRLADFPALQPMVAEMIRPAPSRSHRLVPALVVIGVIAALTAAFFTLSY